MFRKSLFTIGFFTVMTLGAALLNSCVTTDDTCGDVNYTAYETVNFTAMPIEIIGVDNTGQRFQTATYTSQELRYDSVGIVLNYDLNEIGMVKQDISFMKSAYACSLIPPYDYLSSLAIYSDTDYNASYPAGTDLSPIIRLSVDLGTRRETAPLDEELDGSTVMIVFEEAPDEAGAHTFHAELRLTNTAIEHNISVTPINIRP